MINYSVDASINNNKALDDIICHCTDKKKKSVLQAYKKNIRIDYAKYRLNHKNLQSIYPDSSLSADCKEYLKATYKSSPKALEMIKRKILTHLPDALQDKCPYCMIGEHNSFDHYLSKNNYPEYSLLSYNLIPACSRCNSLKGDSGLDSSGNRQFLHFVFDKMPDYTFLRYLVDVENNRIVLKDIQLTFQGNEPAKDIIFNHFTKLDLFNRLKRPFNSTISSLVEIFKGSREDVNGVKSLLSRFINSQEKIFGKNYWEACIYRAVMESDSALKYLSEI